MGHHHRKETKNAYQIEFEGYYFGLRGLIYGPNLGNFDVEMPFKSETCCIPL